MYECWIEIEEAIPILCVRGDLDLFAWKGFPEQVARLPRDTSCAVLEVTGVTYLDMHAVRALEHLAQLLHGRGGFLVIADASPIVRRVLEIVGADRQVLLAGSREEALALISRHMRGRGNHRSP
jgi:anti-anti-sigma factor